MKNINIRQTEEKSKIGNYTEVRKQIRDSQLKRSQKIKAVDNVAEKASLNITKPISPNS